VIIARDLWLGYDTTDGEWGTGWTMVNTTTIAAYSNIVSAVLRVGPTLTGTGASGTWSINVTGNAGGSSASCTGNSATTTLATKATRANGDFYIDDNFGNTIVGLYSPTKYQGVFTMGNAYKLAVDGSGTGNLYGIAWSHPNAGGVAANLSDHGALIIQNGAFSAAISSSIRCTVDMRTPIYYDSNDTAYYINPNSETRLYKASIYAGNEASNTGANGSTEGLILRGNYNSNTWAKKFHNYDNGSGIQLYLAETVGAGAWSTLQGWGTGLGYTSRVFGSFAADSALYSPIFYDTGNTAYYCDPAGSSNFSIVTAGEFYTANWFRNNTSGYGIYNQVTAQHFYSDTANYWNVASSASAQGIRLRTGGYAGTVRGYFYADTNNDVGLLNQDGNWRVRVVGGDYTLIDGSSVRAQIFYDSNDTAYYCDPASTSRVSTLYVANVLADSASVNGRILLYGNLHIDAYGANDIYCNYYSGKRLRAYKGAGTGAETFRADIDGIIYAFEQFRTPIVYDYNDTAYYLDPANTGTSLLVAGNVGIGTINPTYKLQVNGSFAATTKSFDISHPTKENKRLVYASLEGPENGVYVRGKNKCSTIYLPDYWTGLVHEDSITVSITSIGKTRQNKIRNYSVTNIENNMIQIFTDSEDEVYDFNYIVYAERKDVAKLVVEKESE